MKATKETQDRLALALGELTTLYPEEVKEYRQEVKFAKCQFTAFCWGLYFKLRTADKLAIRDNQGDQLNDNHLETALKSTLSAYKDIT